MPEIMAMRTRMSDGGRLQRGCPTQPKLQPLAQVEAIRQRLKVGEDPTTGELDAIVAPWFDAAVDAWGKEEAYAETLGISRQHLALMRQGKKAAPLRALLPLLHSRAAVLAFVRSMCDAVDLEPPQPKPRLSGAQLHELLIALVAGNPVLLAALQTLAAERHGAEPEEVVRAARITMPTTEEK